MTPFLACWFSSLTVAVWSIPNDVFRDSKDFVDGVDDAVSGVLVQFLNSGSVVSLCDDVVLLLVLLRVDRRSGEGFVRVPDQTQRVYCSFHQMFVDDLRCLFLSECLSSKLVESFVDWGEEGERSVILNCVHEACSFNRHLECRETGVEFQILSDGVLEWRVNEVGDDVEDSVRGRPLVQRR